LLLSSALSFFYGPLLAHRASFSVKNEGLTTGRRMDLTVFGTASLQQQHALQQQQQQQRYEHAVVGVVLTGGKTQCGRRVC